MDYLLYYSGFMFSLFSYILLLTNGDKYVTLIFIALSWFLAFCAVMEARDGNS